MLNLLTFVKPTTTTFADIPIINIHQEDHYDKATSKHNFHLEEIDLPEKGKMGKGKYRSWSGSSLFNKALETHGEEKLKEFAKTEEFMYEIWVGYLRTQYEEVCENKNADLVTEASNKYIEEFNKKCASLKEELKGAEEMAIITNLLFGKKRDELQEKVVVEEEQVVEELLHEEVIEKKKSPKGKTPKKRKFESKTPLNPREDDEIDSVSTPSVPPPTLNAASSLMNLSKKRAFNDPSTQKKGTEKLTKTKKEKLANPPKPHADKENVVVASEKKKKTAFNPKKYERKRSTKKIASPKKIALGTISNRGNR